MPKQKGGKRKKTAWDHHVAKTRSKNAGMSFKEVLRLAGKTYKKSPKVTPEVAVERVTAVKKTRKRHKRRKSRKSSHTKKKRHRRRRRRRKGRSRSRGRR
ncbi:MAG: hypothetical protein V3S69_06410 [Dehalococcoidales bacterium]